MQTSNLRLQLLEVGQKEKEVTINTNFTAVDCSSTITTTNATATDIPLTDDLIGLVFGNDTSYDFNATVIARNAATGSESKSFKVDFMISRDATAASVVLVGAPTVSTRFSGTGTASWSVSVSTNTTDGAPRITVTGESGKTIVWVLKCTVTKVTA